MSSVVLAKLIAGPLVIGITSLAGQRWGQQIAGVLAGLPSLALLIIGVLWLEQGADFTRHVIEYAPIGLFANAVYILLLAHASRFFKCFGTVVVALLGYFLMAELLVKIEALHIHYTGIYSLAFLALVYKAIPIQEKPAIKSSLPNSELFARMALAAALIMTLSATAPALGEAYSGIFTAFPVASLILPAFTFALHGRAALLHQLRGFVLGLIGFALCFLLWPLGIAQWGFAALIPALIAAVACTASLHFLAQRALFPART
ncbi:hypothetical protein HQ393_00830 [Chitinibacter bivalviorum]|uniref:Uncharacterized protein n=1 Tax=Chitinibacter bivalviorum TaxID=2739434 RepID=A0A7H9BFD1_9NEIS|nr:hypothetical protein [Chitinibacter bivalviorum]QLG86898.1 hypothetical protein HQ393_00830 [Chitinibacter bivalviorum]